MERWRCTFIFIPPAMQNGTVATLLQSFRTGILLMQLFMDIMYVFKFHAAKIHIIFLNSLA